MPPALLPIDNDMAAQSAGRLDDWTEDKAKDKSFKMGHIFSVSFSLLIIHLELTHFQLVSAWAGSQVVDDAGHIKKPGQYRFGAIIISRQDKSKSLHISLRDSADIFPSRKLNGSGNRICVDLAGLVRRGLSIPVASIT